jgi:hypothetical protein
MTARQFAILSDAIDELEDAAAVEIGRTDDFTGAIRAIESIALGLNVRDGDALAWKLRRLVRALTNEWDASGVGPLCASILAEVRALAEEDAS